MLNLFQLQKITKDDVVDAFKDNVAIMNNHQFEKLRKLLNTKGMFDNVYKRKLQEL